MSVDLGVRQVKSWRKVLAGLHSRFASRFSRSEPRGRALEYMAGLIAPVERKNGWSLAERAGEAHPIGMQRLLGEADWDADGVRDDVRDFVVETIADWLENGTRWGRAVHCELWREFASRASSKYSPSLSAT